MYKKVQNKADVTGMGYKNYNGLQNLIILYKDKSIELFKNTNQV